MTSRSCPISFPHRPPRLIQASIAIILGILVTQKYPLPEGSEGSLRYPTRIRNSAGQRLCQKGYGISHLFGASQSKKRVTLEAKNGWKDQWTEEGDREALPPKKLAVSGNEKTVVLVRHGQSTWNAAGRIQGSSNFSVLTNKGRCQAELTRDYLSETRFDKIYQSPLARALETSEIICETRPEQKRSTLASLREIDLYSFQGLRKEEGLGQYGQQYDTWKNSPAEFELDGHKPVVELWYRASIAWETILNSEAKNILVVAHNAINQALIGVATGLPPEYFRRINQDNAAITQLRFGDGDSDVVIERINQSPYMPRMNPTVSRIFLLHPAVDPETAIETLLPGFSPKSPTVAVSVLSDSSDLESIRVAKEVSEIVGVDPTHDLTIEKAVSIARETNGDVIIVAPPDLHIKWVHDLIGEGLPSHAKTTSSLQFPREGVTILGVPKHSPTGNIFLSAHIQLPKHFTAV